MTERPGGSDVGRTETAAEPQRTPPRTPIIGLLSLYVSVCMCVCVCVSDRH
jgi:hypothetical protein